jgi:CRP-like cAMP-binding protein
MQIKRPVRRKGRLGSVASESRMSARPVIQPPPETGRTPRSGSFNVLALQAPRKNHLLAALPKEDYERLLPHLEPVVLPRGCVLHRAGEPEPDLYFLTSGLVSRLSMTRDGTSTEFAITGREGVIGVASFLGGRSTPSQAVVLRAGYAYRLAKDLLEDELERDGALTGLLLRFTQALIAQAGQIAACNRHHALEQQLGRWLLACLDRLASNELRMTQELIARVLGVRRQGITEAALKLRKAGLIQYSRGRIVVIDRVRLEALACECYGVVKREYDRLLPENGQPQPAA